MTNKTIFEDLFVLEMTNNHLGDVGRGLRIVEQFSNVVRRHSVKAAIKLQFRDIDGFIHKSYRSRTDIQYIKRITETRLSEDEYLVLVDAIRDSGCIPLATPFDEKSVDLCIHFDMPIIKVASVHSNDWFLLHKIASTKRPVIASVGGLKLDEIDRLVNFFDEQNIPLAINHCITAYPTGDSNLELNQIDLLRKRYPNHVIGLSAHNHDTSFDAMLIAYAKGARLFERHIDIQGKNISQYSSLPEEIDLWLATWLRAKQKCGQSSNLRIQPSVEEKDYIYSHLRGIYAKTDLKVGHKISASDFYPAIPLHKGQFSTKEIVHHELIGKTVIQSCSADNPILITAIDCNYRNNLEYMEEANLRGIDLDH